MKKKVSLGLVDKDLIHDQWAPKFAAQVSFLDVLGLLIGSMSP